MEIIIGIIVGSLFVFGIFLWLRHLNDLFEAFNGFIRCCRAKIYDGTVISSLGTEQVRDLFMSKHQTYSTYETYEASYTFKGEKLVAHVFSSERDLQPGDYIRVYVFDNNGIPEIQSDTYGKRLKAYLITQLIIVIGIAAFVLCIYLLN